MSRSAFQYRASIYFTFCLCVLKVRSKVQTFFDCFSTFFVPELSYVVDDVDVEDVVDALVLQNQSGRRRSLTFSGVDQASVEVLAVCLQTIFLHQFSPRDVGDPRRHGRRQRRGRSGCGSSPNSRR